VFVASRLLLFLGTVLYKLSYDRLRIVTKPGGGIQSRKGWVGVNWGNSALSVCMELGEIGPRYFLQLIVEICEFWKTENNRF